MRDTHSDEGVGFERRLMRIRLRYEKLLEHYNNTSAAGLADRAQFGSLSRLA